MKDNKLEREVVSCIASKKGYWAKVLIKRRNGNSEEIEIPDLGRIVKYTSNKNKGIIPFKRCCVAKKDHSKIILIRGKRIYEKIEIFPDNSLEYKPLKNMTI